MRAFPCLIAFTLAAAPAAAQDDRPLRIAVVNLEVVLATSTAGIELKREMEAFERKASAELKKMADTASAIRSQMVDGMSALSESKLLDLQKELEDAEIAIRRYERDQMRELEKMREAGLAIIEKQLAPIFTEMQERDQYDLVLNELQGIVLMVGDRVDLTADIVRKLNTRSPSN